MLIVSLLAGASGLVLISAAPQVCAAQKNAIPVSQTPSAPDPASEGGKLPGAEEKSRDPAVLLPECKAEPRKKRKKRLSDYPMA
jgi:hypothetical protein